MTDITGGIALLIVYEVLWQDFLQHVLDTERRMGIAPGQEHWQDRLDDRSEYFQMMLELRAHNPESAQAVIQGLFDKFGVDAELRIGRREL